MAFKIQAFKLFNLFSLSLNALYCADWSESKYVHKDTITDEAAWYKYFI